MRDLLERIDVKHPNLIVKFGGHAMAAGLTIHQNNFLKFQHIFDEVIDEIIAPEQLQGVIYTDGELSSNELNIHIAELLQKPDLGDKVFPNRSLKESLKYCNKEY